MAKSRRPSFYEVLGISPQADSEAIQVAYRKLAAENNQDYGRANLKKEEAELRDERMKRINEAYQVLGDQNRRALYDRIRTRSPEGKPGPETTREGGIRLPVRHEATNIKLTDTDLGLLVALKKAYESKEDGNWKVRKNKKDERQWMPDEIYLVRRENGQVSVSRRIIDWRFPNHRDAPISVMKKELIWMVDPLESMEPAAYLSEYYLYGRGYDKLVEKHRIPEYYGEFLVAMKNLASKLARKETGIENHEVEAIHDYSIAMSKTDKARMEGGVVLPTDKDREVIKIIPLKDLRRKMKGVEGIVKGPERYRPTGLEGPLGLA